MSYPSGSSTEKRTFPGYTCMKKDMHQKVWEIKHKLHLQKYKNAESGCLSFSLCPISMEKQPPPENVNLHGRIARSLAGRLVSGKYMRTV